MICFNERLPQKLQNAKPYNYFCFSHFRLMKCRSGNDSMAQSSAKLLVVNRKPLLVSRPFNFPQVWYPAMWQDWQFENQVLLELN